MLQRVIPSEDPFLISFRGLALPSNNNPPCQIFGRSFSVSNSFRSVCYFWHQLIVLSHSFARSGVRLLRQNQCFRTDALPPCCFYVSGRFRPSSVQHIWPLPGDHRRLWLSTNQSASVWSVFLATDTLFPILIHKPRPQLRERHRDRGTDQRSRRRFCDAGLQAFPCLHRGRIAFSACGFLL